MRFYYFSVFSWIAYGLYLAIVLGILWGFWTKVLKLRLRNPAYWLLVLAVVVSPWIEELWIAYNFDRLCRKDAGVFVNNTAEVDGFYDDTAHWWRQLAESDYKFVESKDYIDKSLWRAERAGDEIRHFRIEKPTARYWYRATELTEPVSYKINKTEYRVEDRETQTLLARETVYGRHAYWFFISLGAPVMLCPAAGERRDSTGPLYARVLVAAKAK